MILHITEPKSGHRWSGGSCGGSSGRQEQRQRGHVPAAQQLVKADVGRYVHAGSGFRV